MALTQVSSLDVSKTTYDRLAYFSLRPELYFDQVADVMPTAQSMPGASVQFTIVSDLAVASGTISETADITAVAMSDSTVSVTLAEYGNVVATTAKLRGTAFIEIDPVVANVIGYNAGVSIDTVARNTLRDFVLTNGTSYWDGVGTGTWAYSAGAWTQNPTTTAATNNATGSAFAKERAILRANNVASFGGFYAAYVHPDVAYDIQQDTGTAGWRLPHIYSQPGEIWSGELGAFEGFRFIETPRAPVWAKTASTAGDIYQSICIGRQGLAKAHSITDGNGAMPHIVPGPVTDYLRRFVPLGWYWLGGYTGFRAAAVRSVISNSSLPLNQPAINN
jgi:N4-gp56 family major capsid protein